MSSEPGNLLEFTGTVCKGCGEVRSREELDLNSWCDACQVRTQKRIRIGQHVVAAAIVLPFAIWVLLVDKYDFLPPYAWLIPLAAAYYLGMRIGRESIKGYFRWRRAG
jgi:hypothetical protein